MRKIQIFSIILFVLAIGVYGFYKVNEVRNSDHTGPVITMDEESITISVEDSEDAMLEGIQAIDEKDGDVSDSLIVESVGNFIEEGRRTITVAAFDADNHVTKASREVIYSDYTSPVFSLSAPLKFPLNTDNILSELSVMDVLDGDITSNIKISSEYTIDTSTAGDYEVEFRVSNSAGDVVTLPVTVQIYDTSEEYSRPQIELSEYLVYTEAGKELEPWDYVEKITMQGIEYSREDDGVLRGYLEEDEEESGEDAEEEEEELAVKKKDVSITDETDYDTPGVYEITYEIEDDKDETGSVRLIVIVSE